MGKALFLLLFVELASAFQLAPFTQWKLRALHKASVERLCGVNARISSGNKASRCMSLDMTSSSSESSSVGKTLSPESGAQALKKQIELLWDLEDSIRQFNFGVSLPHKDRACTFLCACS